MSEWTTDELARIGEAGEVDIATRRADGTLRIPRRADRRWGQAWSPDTSLIMPATWTASIVAGHRLRPTSGTPQPDGRIHTQTS